LPDEEESPDTVNMQSAVEVTSQDAVSPAEEQLSLPVNDVSVAGDEKKETSQAEVVETETHTQCKLNFHICFEIRCSSVMPSDWFELTSSECFLNLSGKQINCNCLKPSL
jgi:hypothetical protein